MKDKYALKHRVYFHPETHTYLPDKEKYELFCEKLENYKEKQIAEGKEPNITMWANLQGWRYGKLQSTTSLLGKVFPFNGGDDFIKKAWLEKISRKGLLDMDQLTHFITVLDDIKEILDADVAQSQIQGTEAHEMIQDWMEQAIEKGTLNLPIGDNKYAKAFVEQLPDNRKIRELVENVAELLPCEVPVGYFDHTVGQHTFTGMWDGLWKMKDGQLWLIDIKTGSPVKYDKALKVEHQLNAYNNLVLNNMGLKVDKHVCIEVSLDYDKKNNKWVYNVKPHFFEPDPKSFFELLDAHSKLEKLKKGSKGE